MTAVPSKQARDCVPSQAGLCFRQKQQALAGEQHAPPAREGVEGLVGEGGVVLQTVRLVTDEEVAGTLGAESFGVDAEGFVGNDHDVVGERGGQETVCGRGRGRRGGGGGAGEGEGVDVRTLMLFSRQCLQSMPPLPLTHGGDGVVT